MKKKVLILVCFNLLRLAAIGVHLQGPVFLYEPPHRIEFSNTSGGKADCQAHGVPFPVLKWILTDGTPVTQIPEIRIVHENGSLIFPAFPPEKFRHDVHAAVYRCIAKNQVGLILSREVVIKAVVNQKYDVQVYDEYVISGNTAVMTCHVPNYLSDYIIVTSWVQDDVVHIYPTMDIVSGGKYVVLKTGELFIFNVSFTDGYKSYACWTVNKLTGKSQSTTYPARVVITEEKENIPPRMSVDKHSTKYIKMEEDVFLQCIAQGYPVPTYRWFKEEKEQLFPVEFDERFTEIAQGLLLHIAKVKLKDGGIYFCSANNSAGKETIRINLVVLAPLSAHIQPQTQTIGLSKEVELSCVIGGFPVSSVIWLHNGKPVSHSAKHVLKTHPDRLLIKFVEKDDLGMYQCLINNEWDMVQSSAELQLGDAGPELLSWFTERTLSPGPSLSLKCTATGNPPPNFLWTLDGFPVPDDNRFMVGQYITVNDDVITHLNISTTGEEDGGEYTCTAKNSISQVAHSARINIYGRPYIRKMPKVNGIAGVDLVIKCPAAGYPIESITWEQGGISLPINHRQKVFSNGTLVIENVQKESDSGTYTCRASDNQRNSDRRDVEVHVMVPPKILPIQGIVLREGMRAAITCQVIEGDLPFKFHWEKDGKPIADSKLQIRRVDEYSSLLVIDYISTLHSGNYTCFAENVAGVESFTVPLTVNVSPKWLIEPSDLSTTPGLDVIIDCQATGFPIPSIFWKKSIGSLLGEYKELLYEPNVNIYPNGSLKLMKVSKKNEGHYLCEAKNDIGSGVSKLIYLKVNLQAHFAQKFKQILVVQGEEAHLQCSAIGDIPIQIHWKLNSQKISRERETRYVIREQSLDEGLVSGLSILQSDRQDTGIFSCHASNAFGEDEMKIQLIVQEIPETPINVRVIEQESRALQVTWTQPFAGNSPITNYIVEFKLVEKDWENKSDKIIVSGTKTSARIQNLWPAKAYNVRIFAENNLGKSYPSVGIQVTTQEEAPAAAPMEVSAKAESSTEIRVTWIPPSKNQQNGKLLGYYVGYKQEFSTKESANSSLELVGYNFKTVEAYGQNAEETILEKLKKFSLYSIIVQAFNSKGTGPFSTPIVVRTNEDVPSSSPENAECQTLSSQSIEIRWKPPNPDDQNGHLLGYKLSYWPANKWDNDNKIETKVTTLTKTILSGLLKYTNYSVTLSAFTSAGDGVRSPQFFCSTDEDTPSPPKEIKGAMSSLNKIIVTWLPPIHKNGRLTCYTIYMSTIENGKEEGTHKRTVKPEVEFYETDRDQGKATYQFWVTASTKMGEGESSKTITISSSTKVPARILSFDQTLITPWKETLNLTCRKVGVPNPQLVWKFRQKTLDRNAGRRQVYKDGSLIIKDVDKSDQGNYSCSVENQHGKDEIIYNLIVKVPPERPKLSVVSTTSDSLQLEWSASTDSNENEILGFVINYKRDHGDWQEVQLGVNFKSYHLKSLWCATHYQLYITAYNKIGMGLPCDIVNTRTLGGVPVKPNENTVIKLNATTATIWLDSWLDNGCPISHFIIEYQIPQLSSAWSIASNNAQPHDRFFLLTDLIPGTEYNVRITAHNNAGSSVAVYNFTTPTITGVLLLPPNESEILNSNIVPSYMNQISMITLVLSVFSVAMILVALVFFIKKKKMLQQTVSTLVESSSMTPMQNDPEHQYISIEVPKKFSSGEKPFAVKNEEYTNDISPYAAFKISQAPYSESSYSGNVYSGTYNFAQSSLPFEDLKDSYRMKLKKDSSAVKIRRKDGKFKDSQSGSQDESDNFGSTDSEVKRIFSMHRPISEYDTLESDFERENKLHKQEHTPFRHTPRSNTRVSRTKSESDDSSTSSEISQNKTKYSLKKSRSKGQHLKKHVNHNSAGYLNMEETTFSSHPTLKMAYAQPRFQGEIMNSEGKLKEKQKSAIKGNSSSKFNQETSFQIDV